LLLASALPGAAAAGPPGPLVSVVIDDLGNFHARGLEAIELPGPITYAVLPHTPHGPSLARRAHSLGKEVLVHLPMEAAPERRLGPGALTASLHREQFHRRLRSALNSVPHAVGASNHMGSRLTTLAQPMGWLMEELAGRRGWVFLDSRTTPGTVAEASARAAGLATTRRDVFLDNVPARGAVRMRFHELVATALRDGSAVAIGHPHPQTLEVLARQLPRLDALGVRLVPLSVLIRHRLRAPFRVAQSSSPGHAASTR
jgi:polysaccharide deacetylase 2 family uncharacterized protein YibQ